MNKLVQKLKKKLTEDYTKIEGKYDIINTAIITERDTIINKIQLQYNEKLNTNNQNKEQELLKYNSIAELRLAKIINQKYEYSTDNTTTTSYTKILKYIFNFWS